MSRKIITMVQCVDATDIPGRCESDCEELGISLHCECGLHSLYDDDSEFSTWLKEQGFVFEDNNNFTWLGVWGT